MKTRIVTAVASALIAGAGFAGAAGAFNPQPEPPREKAYELPGTTQASPTLPLPPPKGKLQGRLGAPQWKGGDRAFNPQPEPPKAKSLKRRLKRKF